MVGLNKYKTKEDVVAETQTIDRAAVQHQLNRLNKLKKNRDTDYVQKSLITLKKIAAGDENLLPQIIDSVKAHATLGEISDTLREVFGEY